MTPTPASASPSPSTSPDNDYARRFGGTARLYGAPALARFEAAHVCVVGVGGVGSWAAEALARSAIGTLTLIDLDHVAPSNINRQGQALTSTLGMAKIEALKARLRDINPRLVVHLVDAFVEPENVAELLGGSFDDVVDAIDSLVAKAALVAWCKQAKVPVIVSGGAGGQIDPTRIRIEDLSRTTEDPVASKLRYTLRRRYGFPREAGKKFGVACVFSTEPLRYPEASCDSGTGGAAGLNCAGFGSSMCVTAGFGLAAASHVLGALAQPPKLKK